LNNACISKACPFYLVDKGDNKFKNHLRVWKNKIPRSFHKIVAENYKKKDEKIFDYFMKKNPNFNFSFFGYTKEEVYEYIKKLKEYFKNEYK